MACPFVSIIICTHNRSRQLRDACAAALAVDYPSEAFELLIVNNRSTDDTRAVAEEIARENPAKVRVVDEPEIGLSRARNTGIREAKGEVIAFLDDDAFPAREWLGALVDALERDDTLVAGGPVDPILQGDLPPWFSERFLPYLSAWDRGPELHRLTYSEYPRGNNIAFRREVFERFGDFTTHLGRKGPSLLSCEETELCLRVERAGGAIVYVPEARVRHVTFAERATEHWLERRFAAQGRSEAILEWRHGGWRAMRIGWLCRLKIVLYSTFVWYRSVAKTLPGMQLPETTGAYVTRDQRKSDAAMYARCQRRAFRAYSGAMIRAPWGVPRYRPPHGTPPWPPR